MKKFILVLLVLFLLLTACAPILYKYTITLSNGTDKTVCAYNYTILTGTVGSVSFLTKEGRVFYSGITYISNAKVSDTCDGTGKETGK